MMVSSSAPTAPHQRHDPHFRLFLYSHSSSPWLLPVRDFPRPPSGPQGYGVITLDITANDWPGATLARVYEDARGLAGEHSLWSIALVLGGGETDGTTTGETLLWLDGTDYAVAPEDITDPAQRGGRAAMQDRYLRARHDLSVRDGEHPRLPNGQRVIRLFPDWGRDEPLWENFSANYLVTAADLTLSDALSRHLHTWNAVWTDRDPEYGVLPPDWLDQGWALHRRLQAELGESAEVRPDFAR